MHASLSKLSKELKNGTEILVGQAVFKLWIKTVRIMVMTNNSRIAWPTEILMPCLSSLGNFL